MPRLSPALEAAAHLSLASRCDFKSPALSSCAGGRRRFEEKVHAASTLPQRKSILNPSGAPSPWKQEVVFITPA